MFKLRLVFIQRNIAPVQRHALYSGSIHMFNFRLQRRAVVKL